MLKINKLNAKIDSKEILKGLALEINTGEVHANNESKWIWKKYINKYFIR